MSNATNTEVRGMASSLTPDLYATLRAAVRGAVCLPGEPGYDQARTIWNAMIDRHPAVIVRASGAADVIQAVNFAREHSLRLAVRGGGHNIAGNAVCEGGLMIDLTPMKSVRVDPVARTARVEPGVTLGEFDRETQAFGLATPVGINSTTGIAGLTLGGGFGWLSRKYGLTIDNLLSVDLVTARGELVHASEKDNPELFWAVRGGGGNFGVVTSFEFKLHQVGPQVLSGLIVHPFANAKELLQAYRKIVASAPDELTCWAVMRKAPPLPFLPAEVHGTEVLVFALCFCGDPEAGRKAIAPLQALGKPIADVVGLNPLAGWQTAFDPLLTPGVRNYWKSHDFRELSDAALEVVLGAIRRLPSPDCEVFIGHLDGAVNRVPVTATAYPHRDVAFVLNVHTRWNERAQDDACIAWARELFDQMTPHATGGVYVNFMPEDEAARVKTGAYGPNFEKLARVKAKFDPSNLFRGNQNIAPAS
ncbi:MAG: FAD-binding oxidoreductase [Candidatus Eisenbacteria bacterium]|uniref:FAD-binding oxidoreductase n=1 Tax=Eiseniibacteriota bacterium TaxID=2212470 RepID=A0A849SUH0_UNCEI|nr:FAD-binding oxidoreductase [Candidatus Eisenbacteria bacterium]